MWTMIVLAAGVVIGWQFPQPKFAKTVQDKAVAWVKTQWAKLLDHVHGDST